MDLVPIGPPVVQEGLQAKYAGFLSHFTAFAVDLGVSLVVFILALAAISFAARALTGKDTAARMPGIVITGRPTRRSGMP